MPQPDSPPSSEAAIPSRTENGGPASLVLQRERSCYPVSHIATRFGMRLRDLRKSKRLTQDMMAAQFGIDRSFISDLERGHKSICLPLLDVLAKGLNLSLSDLLRNL